MLSPAQKEIQQNVGGDGHDGTAVRVSWYELPPKPVWHRH